MFECEHKIKFVVEGSEQKHKDLWSRMKKDSTVTIFYREVYHVDNKTGQKSLFDYDFLDAKWKRPFGIWNIEKKQCDF